MQRWEFQRPIRGFRLAQHVDGGQVRRERAVGLKARRQRRLQRVNVGGYNGFRPRAGDGLVRGAGQCGDESGGLAVAGAADERRRLQLLNRIR